LAIHTCNSESTTCTHEDLRDGGARPADPS
jgi:hypothetical protein